jgi:undecaprenyl-diphosphatase
MTSDRTDVSAWGDGASSWRKPGVLVLLGGLALLAAAGLLGVDQWVSGAVKTHLPRALHQVADGISLLGSSAVYPLIAAFLLGWTWWRRRARRVWQACLWVLIAEGVAAIVVRLLKVGFGRWRPRVPQGGEFEFFDLRSKCHSFPSGHTADAAAVAAVLWCVFPRLRPFCVAWVVLMAASRICALQHFVADTATGAALGILCALVLRPKMKSVEDWVCSMKARKTAVLVLTIIVVLLFLLLSPFVARFGKWRTIHRWDAPPGTFGISRQVSLSVQSCHAYVDLFHLYEEGRVVVTDGGCSCIVETGLNFYPEVSDSIVEWKTDGVSIVFPSEVSVWVPRNRVVARGE